MTVTTTGRSLAYEEVAALVEALGHDPKRVTRISIDARAGVTVVELVGGPLERRIEHVTTHRWVEA